MTDPGLEVLGHLLDASHDLAPDQIVAAVTRAGQPWMPRMLPSTWSTTSRPCSFRCPTAPTGPRLRSTPP
jgi:hypothetical protein